MPSSPAEVRDQLLSRAHARANDIDEKGRSRGRSSKAVKGRGRRATVSKRADSGQGPNRPTTSGVGRVGVWRGGVRLSISVCRPFRRMREICTSGSMRGVWKRSATCGSLCPPALWSLAMFPLGRSLPVSRGLPHVSDGPLAHTANDADQDKVAAAADRAFADCLESGGDRKARRAIALVQAEPAA